MSAKSCVERSGGQNSGRNRFAFLAILSRDETMSAEELDERVKEILSAVVANYIRTAEPVGSRALSKVLEVSLSPATIRNTMSGDM